MALRQQSIIKSRGLETIMNILIVDDHAENLYLLESLLKGNGHTVREAANGADALAILQTGGIDLIISDILMPVMDGFQLCRKVKTDPTLLTIPFIIYTATFTGPKDEAFAMQIGADRFVLKPCEPEVFMTAIEEVLAAARPRHCPSAPTGEEEVFKLYNERLVRKLEQKMAQAELEIRARQEVEKALRESEEKYRRIFENAVVGFFQSTPQGRFIIVNPAFARMLRYESPAELLSSISDIATQYYVHAQDRQRYTQALDARGYVENFECEACCKDGSHIWVSKSASVHRGEDQRILYYEGIAVDISDRKRAQDALRHAEIKYSRLVQTMTDGFAATDMQGRIQEFNPAFRSMLGYTDDELRRMTYQAFTPDQWHAFEGDIIARQVLPRQYSDVYEKEYRRSDGTIFPVELRTYLIRDDAGLPSGMWAIVRDITERKKLQAQLIQAQKMEAVGRLAGGVAHDYNNMLSVIMGYTELVLERLDQQDPMHADLSEVLTAAKHSRDITRQLLAFARRQTISPKVLDLNESVDGMLKMLRRLIGEDIDLAWRPATGLWPIKMDPSQLDQILANLCVNARDAIAGVGKITIETDKVILDNAYCSDHAGFVPGEFTVLSVSDDGGGMDRQTLDNLFEPFFTTKGVGEGTGLGLATVYGIVKQNEGFINVYSEPGQGSTFRIYLPRHAGEAEETRMEPPDARINGRGETILFVEDEPAILMLGRKILENLGYQVLGAITPSEAIRLAEEHAGEVDLLITDVVMPEMNGRDLASQLQSLYPEMKILFMSGYTANVIAHRGILDDGVNFIQKPFSKDGLAAKVRATLG
jgi:PAS domain S-box-containing protein